MEGTGQGGVISCKGQGQMWSFTEKAERRLKESQHLVQRVTAGSTARDSHNEVAVPIKIGGGDKGVERMEERIFERGVQAGWEGYS